MSIHGYYEWDWITSQPLKQIFTAEKLKLNDFPYTTEEF